ncbi:hypothetical protein NliqN6_1929 [Naganishia liquefaciens]|uniref:Uncharacterized protein n=1 Tax=Naganishia liquefaciens TaxID=104408 RepID=A0A8H3YER9_9TREE|nr:hypothetical protein NliqN6_1929 [Naganishia liquefaciens]
MTSVHSALLPKETPAWQHPKAKSDGDLGVSGGYLGIDAGLTTDASGWAAVKCKFGLKDTSELGWQRLRVEVAQLQASAKSNERYKVLFCARHGLAKHNWAAPPPGPPETSEEDKGKLLDPELTSVGENQARTLALSFEGLLHGKRPIFIEGLREKLHVRLCDKRQTKVSRRSDSSIQATMAEPFPLLPLKRASLKKTQCGWQVSLGEQKSDVKI